MEKTMMLPAMYNVLSQEEMTYTEGGATMTQALLAALLPPYGWYKASTEIRDYRKKNPNTWLDTITHIVNPQIMNWNIRCFISKHSNNIISIHITDTCNNQSHKN